jgi:DNA-directed RNA polymerase II subunit RPB1
MAHKLSSYVKYISFKEIIDRIEFIYDPNPALNEGYTQKDDVKNPFFIDLGRIMNNISGMPYLLRIILNREQLIDKDINMLDIKAKFTKFWEDKFNDIKNIKKEEKDVLLNVISCAILSNHDNSKIPIIHIRFDLSNINFNILVRLERMIANAFNLKGIDNITDIYQVAEEEYVDFDNESGDIKRNKQHVIITNGVNLIDIRYIKGFDIYRTITNDIMEVYNKFGIEGARHILIKELYNLFKNSGNNVIYQHIELLADIMTNSGYMMSIDRHGINKLDTDPLSRASFEKTIDQLLTSAVFGEKDYMRSVSSRIMTGKCIKGGTGLCEIILDTDIIENTEVVEMKEKPMFAYKTFKPFVNNNIMNDIINKSDINAYIPVK